jgi:hypothetical protein
VISWNRSRKNHGLNNAPRSFSDPSRTSGRTRKDLLLMTVLTTPTTATEWYVEAKSGGTCIVRVVHSLFAETDDWDQLTGTESGCPLSSLS